MTDTTQADREAQAREVLAAECRPLMPHTAEAVSAIRSADVPADVAIRAMLAFATPPAGIDDAPEPAVPVGWKLVPVAPTLAMEMAGLPVVGLYNIWSAMLAAAPATPTPIAGVAGIDDDPPGDMTAVSKDGGGKSPQPHPRGFYSPSESFYASEVSAFEAAHPFISHEKARKTDGSPEDWGRIRYHHSHVDAMFDGWVQGRYSLTPMSGSLSTATVKAQRLVRHARDWLTHLRGDEPLARATLAANLERVINSLAALSAPPPVQAGEVEAVAWVSPGQFANLRDIDEGGAFLPVRKSRAGNFTMPLYASTPVSQPIEDRIRAEGEQ